MNRTEFLSLIAHPENSGNISLAETEKVISEFPYWQGIRLIYVKALQQKQHFSYQSQLKLSSIYAGDRKTLFELINKGVEINSLSINDASSKTSIEENNIKENAAQIETTEVVLDIDDNQIEKIENNFSIEEQIAPLDESAPNVEDTIGSGVNYDDSTNNIIESTDMAAIVQDTESDLSQLIEQRIKELMQQNSSYAITHEGDVSEEESGSGSDSVNKVEGDSERESASVSGNQEPEKLIESINHEAPNTETVSITEEMAAFDVYEETAIADDLFKAEVIEFHQLPHEIIDNTENTNTESSAQAASNNHSFLNWFKVLNAGERESESVLNTITSESSVAEPETIAQSDEIFEKQLSNSFNDKHVETKVLENEIEYEHHTANEIVAISNPIPETKDNTIQTTLETASLKPPSDLVSKFIADEPRIQAKKNAFFSPSVAARNSVVYHEEVVSETLAEIFHKQQLYDKALRAYEKLTLMFPEKSSLFAARIEKIKEEKG